MVQLNIIIICKIKQKPIYCKYKIKLIVNSLSNYNLNYSCDQFKNQINIFKIIKKIMLKEKYNNTL